MNFASFASVSLRSVRAGRGLFVAGFGCALAAALFGGCGGNRGPQRVVVSGTVTYNGKPIAKGLVRFVPDAKSDAPICVEPIVEGKYRAEGQGGVPVGTHRVEIESYQVIQGPEAFSAKGRGKQLLPDRFNINSTMNITVAAGGGEITKDFALTD